MASSGIVICGEFYGLVESGKSLEVFEINDSIHSRSHAASIQPACSSLLFQTVIVLVLSMRPLAIWSPALRATQPAGPSGLYSYQVRLLLARLMRSGHAADPDLNYSRL